MKEKRISMNTGCTCKSSESNNPMQLASHVVAGGRRAELPHSLKDVNDTLPDTPVCRLLGAFEVISPPSFQRASSLSPPLSPSQGTERAHSYLATWERHDGAL